MTSTESDVALQSISQQAELSAGDSGATSSTTAVALRARRARRASRSHAYNHWVMEEVSSASPQWYLHSIAPDECLPCVELSEIHSFSYPFCCPRPACWKCIG